MLITRTPLRVSLVGGGSDMPKFYTRYGGAVVSMAINKYIYVSFNRKFDDKIRLSYSKTENVDRAMQLKHDIARVCLEGITGVEITSVSDIPGEGSGLGSSSAFTVGLINAIRHVPSTKMLAEMAYMVELSCEHHCGKQDHYAAAYGGLNLYQFNTNGSVNVEPLLTAEERCKLQKHFVLLWTGRTRRASKILEQQAHNVSENGLAEFAAIDLRNLAVGLAEEMRRGRIDGVGDFLKESWEIKKKLAPGISDAWLDGIHDRALEAGAIGGKVCGAGGGGFMLFFAAPGFHTDIEQATGLRRVPFEIEEKGSEVVYGNR